MGKTLLATYLCGLRKKRGLSIVEAANQIGVSDRHIVVKWEQGEEIPDVGVSSQIAETYMVSEEEVREILELEIS